MNEHETTEGKSITGNSVMDRRGKSGPSMSADEQRRLELALEVMSSEPTKFYRACALAFTRMVEARKRPQWPPAFVQSGDPFPEVGDVMPIEEKKFKKEKP